MKFLQELFLLAEDEFAIQPYAADKDAIIKFIEQNCKPWISEMGGLQNAIKHPFYRGFKQIKTETATFVKKVRPDRIPLSSNRETHNAFNEKIKTCARNEKNIALRHNSLFALSVAGKTRIYGTPFVIFPLNEFAYTWHTSAFDWFVNYDEVLNSKCNEIKINEDLMGAWNAGKEIMIASNSIFAVDKDVFEELQ